jgi:hypothetical protein
MERHGLSAPIANHRAKHNGRTKPDGVPGGGKQSRMRDTPTRRATIT